MSLTSLGAVCNLDRESIAAGMKAIFIKFVSIILSPRLTMIYFSVRSKLLVVVNTASLICVSAISLPFPMVLSNSKTMLTTAHRMKFPLI